jgi:SAM-dependent methyltransferase
MTAVKHPIELERIYPKEMNKEDSDDLASIEIHMDRYQFASENLVGNSILDMACGCGFGTALLAETHPDKFFTGVDIDPRAIEYAKKHYSAKNLNYICADALSWNDGKYDSIVSLETIEHLPTPTRLIQNILSILSDQGRVIASVPVTPTCDGNPHHLHDFTKRSFSALFTQHGFSRGKEFEQRQPWIFKGLFSHQTNVEHRSQNVGNNVLHYYQKHPLALLSRIKSIVTNGLCNIYLTAVFEKH